MHRAILLVIFAAYALAETPLEQQIRAIAADAAGQVAVACALPGSALNCHLNPHAHAPMQSVFKLPLAMAALDRVERGALALDQQVRFRPEDRILPKAYSPLQDKYPAAEVDIPLRELLRLAVSLSDNVAADLVLRLVGGPAVVEKYVHGLGIAGFQLKDGEHALHRQDALQYRNWFEPSAAVQLLRRLSDDPPLSAEHTRLLLDWMSVGIRSRLSRKLPAKTPVMHKAGTSSTQNGVTAATNDIGLIVLPDGRRLAIAIFVTDSHADEAARESVIAGIAEAVYRECVRQ